LDAAAVDEGIFSVGVLLNVEPRAACTDALTAACSAGAGAALKTEFDDASGAAVGIGA